MSSQDILVSLISQPCSSGDVFKDCKIVRSLEVDGLVECSFITENPYMGDGLPNTCDEGKPLLWVEVTKKGYNMVVKNNPGITGYYGEVLEEWKL